MRSLILLLLVAAAAMPLALARKHSNKDVRLCPDGYRYAGDDTVEMNPRDVAYHEIDRTPMYSCYKLVSKRASWLAATHDCWEDDAQLVSFDDVFEMVRVVKMVKSFDDDDDDHDDNDGDDDRVAMMNVFTSAMFFSDIGKWYWVGANKTVPEDMTIVNQDPNNPTIPAPRDCLRANLFGIASPRADADAAANANADDPLPTLSPTSCFHSSYYMCEARVQTVTYVAWFTANWVDLLLGFLLVILFVALCVSVCAYTSNDHHGRQHQAAQAAQRRRGQRRPRTTDPDFPEVIDLPPSYDSTVKVHMPNSQHASSPAAAAATPSRIDYYRTRGRELMARVYFYKETPAKQ